jgi:hypothetical protein
VIALVSLTATPLADAVLLEWETASEMDTAGFNLWRAEAASGPYIQLNADLIPARGEPYVGARYHYIDQAVVRGMTYYYQLEDVDLFGVRTRHGPVTAVVPPYHAYLPLILLEGWR